MPEASSNAANAPANLTTDILVLPLTTTAGSNKRPWICTAVGCSGGVKVPGSFIWRNEAFRRRGRPGFHSGAREREGLGKRAPRGSVQDGRAEGRPPNAVAFP